MMSIIFQAVGFTMLLLGGVFTLVAFVDSYVGMVERLERIEATLKKRKRK